MFASENEDEKKIDLCDVLHFATGCRQVPAEGFQFPLSLTFDHVEINRKVTANTCAGSICIPANSKITSPGSFQQELIEAIINGQGFGTV